MNGWTLILVLTEEKGLPQASLLAHLTNYVMSLPPLSPSHCKQRKNCYIALLPSFQKTEGNLDNSCMRSATCSSFGQLLHLTIFPLKEINVSMSSIRLMQYLPVERMKYNLKTFTPLSSVTCTGLGAGWLPACWLCCWPVGVAEG